MKHILEFKVYKNNIDDIKDKIKNLRQVPIELKEAAYELVSDLTKAEKGKITGLNKHPDLESKIKDGDNASGFSMGIDKDGYFIHTHRGRSKSYASPDKITVEDMRFIDSTG